MSEVKIVTQKEAEKADVVVCRLRVTFERVPDISIVDNCYKCGEEVVIRKNAPKRPKRICIDCAKTHPDMKNSQAITTKEQLEQISPTFLKMIEEFTRQFKTKH